MPPTKMVEKIKSIFKRPAIPAPLMPPKKTMATVKSRTIAALTSIFTLNKPATKLKAVKVLATILKKIPAEAEMLVKGPAILP